MNGRRSTNVAPPPGVASCRQPAAVRARRSRTRWTGPGRCRRCRASGRDRPGRSGRRRGRRARDRCPGRGRRRAARLAGVAPQDDLHGRAGGVCAPGCSRAGCRRPGAGGPRRRYHHAGLAATVTQRAGPARAPAHVGHRVAGDAGEVDRDRGAAGRPWSSRASSSRSSTRLPMRATLGRRSGPSRFSSCGGSREPARLDTGRRTRGRRSAACAARARRRPRTAAAGPRSAPSPRAPGCCSSNACSIWSSMVSKAVPSRPTSVPSCGMPARWVRSPALIASAAVRRSARAGSRRRRMTNRDRDEHRRSHRDAANHHHGADERRCRPRRRWTRVPRWRASLRPELPHQHAVAPSSRPRDGERRWIRAVGPRQGCRSPWPGGAGQGIGIVGEPGRDGHA